MLKFGKISIAGGPSLRAVLAIVFLLMSALQPGLFTNASAAGFHGNAGMSIDIETAGDDARGHDHGHVDETSVDGEGQRGSHHGSKTSADKGCEVHCAPAHAVPVACPDIEPLVARCFPPIVATILPLGEYAALIRPPRHLN